MKNKAIIFDIDGTAVNSPRQKLPSKRLIEAVRNIEESYCISAATGRVWSFAEPVLKGLSLVNPCIISGGTQICDPTSGDILWECSLAEKDAKSVLAIAGNYSQYGMMCNDIDEATYLSGGLEFDKLETDETIYFFGFVFVPQNVATTIVAELSEIEGIAVTLVVSQRAGLNDIHVTNRNATKEHAVAELLNLLNISRENTIGIGDGNNDTHLFDAVQHKVAMGNAVDELKSMADEIVGSAVDDGFAAYLETLDSSRS